MNKTEKQLLKVILINVRAEIREEDNAEQTSDDRATITNIMRKLKL